MGSTIWTIGHSTRPLDAFLELLARYRLEAVADVRRFPGSRRYPQYAGAALSATKLRSSIDAVARSRLVTINVDALLVDVAKLLSDTQISLVVCNSDGAMVGVITKTNIVQQFDRCGESACTAVAADVMTGDVAYCRPTDSSCR